MIRNRRSVVGFSLCVLLLFGVGPLAVSTPQVGTSNAAPVRLNKLFEQESP